MARTPQDVTDAELAVLQVLWDDGPATIRQLTDVLYPGGGTAQYATVQKLLDRLEAKGFVHRDRSAAAHTFTRRRRARRPDWPALAGHGREAVRRLADAAADSSGAHQSG